MKDRLKKFYDKHDEAIWVAVGAAIAGVLYGVHDKNVRNGMRIAGIVSPEEDPLHIHVMLKNKQEYCFTHPDRQV